MTLLNRILHQTVVAGPNNAKAEANVHSRSHQIHRNRLLEVNVPNRSIFRKMDVHSTILSAYHSMPDPGDRKYSPIWVVIGRRHRPGLKHSMLLW